MQKHNKIEHCVPCPDVLGSLNGWKFFEEYTCGSDMHTSSMHTPKHKQLTLEMEWRSWTHGLRPMNREAWLNSVWGLIIRGYFHVRINWLSPCFDCARTCFLVFFLRPLVGGGLVDQLLVSNYSSTGLVQSLSNLTNPIFCIKYRSFFSPHAKYN